jgi:hypothetical protein
VADVSDPVAAQDGETEEFDLQAEETAATADDSGLLALAAGGLFLAGMPGWLPQAGKDNPPARKWGRSYRPGLKEPK